jgi:hypothetical protein
MTRAVRRWPWRAQGSLSRSAPLSQVSQPEVVEDLGEDGLGPEVFLADGARGSAVPLVVGVDRRGPPGSRTRSCARALRTRPRDMIAQTRMPAASGADGTAFVMSDDVAAALPGQQWDGDLLRVCQRWSK